MVLETDVVDNKRRLLDLSSFLLDLGEESTTDVDPAVAELASAIDPLFRRWIKVLGEVI